MKTILVPIDFSEQSHMALSTAVALSKREPAQVHIVHMLELDVRKSERVTDQLRERTDFLVSSAQKTMTAFLGDSEFRGNNFIVHYKAFKVFKEIGELVDSIGAELIVMGSHGTDGMRELFIGSNTEKVVRNSTVPVLVVKNGTYDMDPHTAIIASDLAEEGVSALKRAIAFAKKYRLFLEVVNVRKADGKGEGNSEPADKFALLLGDASNALPFTVLKGDKVEETVLAYARDKGTGLIIVPTHGRKGLEHFFRGSIGEDVANHAHTAVLTLRI
ncbi:MAG: universal stress protein [Bacteroidota bacterium]